MRPGAGLQPKYGVGRSCAFAMSAVTGAGDQACHPDGPACPAQIGQGGGQGEGFRWRTYKQLHGPPEGARVLLAISIDTTASPDSVSPFTRPGAGAQAIGRRPRRTVGLDRASPRLPTAECPGSSGGSRRAVGQPSCASRQAEATPRRPNQRTSPRSGWTPRANRPPGAGTSMEARAMGRFRPSYTPPLLPSGPRPSTLTA